MKKPSNLPAYIKVVKKPSNLPAQPAQTVKLKLTIFLIDPLVVEVDSLEFSQPIKGS